MPQAHRPAPVIAHLLPASVLREVSELARSLQRDELFRRYLVRRLWLILPAGLFFAAVSVACVLGGARVLGWVVGLPLPEPLRVPAAVVLGACFLAAMLTQVYVLFAWLQRRALRAVDASLPRRTGSCAALTTAFVALPLGVLGWSQPDLALGILAGGLLVPAYCIISR